MTDDSALTVCYNFCVYVTLVRLHNNNDTCTLTKWFVSYNEGSLDVFLRQMIKAKPSEQ